MKLNVEVAHPQHAATGFAADGKGLDQQVVQGLARRQSLAELIGLLPQFGVGQLLDLRLQGADGVNLRAQSLEITGVRRPKHARNRALETAGRATEDLTEDFPNAFQNVHGNQS